MASAEEAASKVLGVEPDSKLSRQFEEGMAKVVELHVNIEGIRDAGVETVLMTECVGVSKVVHILRAAGDRLSSDGLGKWDKHMRDSLGRTLNGELDDHSWRQAVDGFKQGVPQLEDRSGLGPPCVPGFPRGFATGGGGTPEQCGRGGHGQPGDVVGDQ